MAGEQRNRRRIDRVTAPDFLDDLDARSPAEVRSMRDDCRAEEARLSYTRRLVQGRLDIARAEVRRRDEGEDSDLISSLAHILADAPTTRSPLGDLRAAPVYTPEAQGSRRSDDSLVDDATLGRLPDLPDEQLVDVVRQLEADERRVSDQRRLVLEHLDELQTELVRRYREGRAGVDEVVVAPDGSGGAE